MKVDAKRIVRGVLKLVTEGIPKWYRLKEREAQRERRFQRIIENSNQRLEKLRLKIELENAKRRTWIEKHNQRKQYG